MKPLNAWRRASGLDPTETRASSDEDVKVKHPRCDFQTPPATNKNKHIKPDHQELRQTHRRAPDPRKRVRARPSTKSPSPPLPPLPALEVPSRPKES
jgi:hypothetical protein